MSEGKPVGSGYFALTWGVIFAAFAGVMRAQPLAIQPQDIFVGWLAVAGLILIAWGWQRLRGGNRADRRIGQSTINMVVGLLGATFAI